MRDTYHLQSSTTQGGSNIPTSPTGKTALHDAASFGREDIVSILLEHDADVAAADASGQYPAAENAYLRFGFDVEL